MRIGGVLLDPTIAGLKPDSMRPIACLSDVSFSDSFYYESCRNTEGTHPVLKWLLYERNIAFGALALTFALNGMYIASVDTAHQAWLVLGTLHVLFAVVMVAVQAINHTTIDASKYRAASAAAETTGSAAGLAWIYLPLLFWIFQTRVVFQLLYLICSVIGVAHHPSYFVFALLDLVSMVNGMQLIREAMFTSASKLIAVMALAIVVLYALAVIGQAQFHGEYGFPDTLVACDVEDKFSDCFRDHIYTFGERAIWNDVLPPSIGAFIYAVFYNVVVVFLLSGIFVGIITDSFGQLRQEELALRQVRLLAFLMGQKRMCSKMILVPRPVARDWLA
jgi:hypothetical protein